MRAPRRNSDFIAQENKNAEALTPRPFQLPPHSRVDNNSRNVRYYVQSGSRSSKMSTSPRKASYLLSKGYKNNNIYWHSSLCIFFFRNEGCKHNRMSLLICILVVSNRIQLSVQFQIITTR